MPTERSKMLAGELYDPLDPELVAGRERARNLCQALNATREAEQKLLNTPEESPDPEERAYAGELGEVLEEAIARLPSGQRLVFVMRHHQGLKLCEIADALGLAEGTVKRQLHAAVHRLREALAAANMTAGERA